MDSSRKEIILNWPKQLSTEFCNFNKMWIQRPFYREREKICLFDTQQHFTASKKIILICISYEQCPQSQMIWLNCQTTIWSYLINSPSTSLVFIAFMLFMWLLSNKQILPIVALILFRININTHFDYNKTVTVSGGKDFGLIFGCDKNISRT